jgi:hypothetical protein
MQKSHRLSIAIIFAVLIAVLCPVIAPGCVVVSHSEHVGTAFRVRVWDRGRPVPALQLELAPSSPDSPNPRQIDALYSTTDADGYARFAGLPAGSYLLSAKNEGEFGYGEFIDVSPNRAPNSIVRLTWPTDTPLSVRSASGTLRVSQYYPQKTQTQFSLSLLDGLSGRTLAVTRTDDQGRFSFTDPLRDGIYLIQVREMSGAITVEVKRNANAEGVDLNLGSTDCGMTYSQRRIYPELITENVCGDVADDYGASVPAARVLLMSNEKEPQIVESTQTDEQGHFVLQEQREGTYELVVKRDGFFPYLQVVHIEPTRDPPKCQKPISVRLPLD